MTASRLLKIFAIVLAIVCTAIPTEAQKKRAKTPAKAKVDPEELRKKATDLFTAYDFEQAREVAEELEKADPTFDADGFTARCDMGINMLQRVENIAIIASFDVDRNKFFSAYRLSEPSGRLVAPASLPAELTEAAPVDALATGPAYLSEDGSMAIWTGHDKDGRNHLVSSHRLSDGSWEDPTPLSEAIDAMVSDAAERLGYPFLMADGTTLYFAADNVNTLGGYDIFVTRDNGNGFLEPQNVGMPYNSPYNDYMLAIDEVTGAGWFASDRNQHPDKVTIYMFVPQDIRINYSADDPDLADHAKITDIESTGANRDRVTAVADAVKALGTATEQREADFYFAMPGGRVITSFDQLSNPAAKEAMHLYLDALFELDRATERLADMRDAYSRNPSNAKQILEAEKQIERQRINLRRLSNNVVKADGRR